MDELKKDSPSAVYNWQKKLEEVHGQILLQADPADINNTGWNIADIQAPSSR
ncbi:hypothetical protein D3C76_1818440 [compost metagenome]